MISTKQEMVIDLENARVVKVIWVDSHHISGWSNVENLPSIIKKTISIGIEIKNTNEAIALALSYSNNLPQVQGVILIPKCCIHSEEAIAVINITEEISL